MNGEVNPVSPKDRAKRRSLSQRIGRKGESLFTTWAIDRHLSPNRAEEDLGVDFFCQVLRASAAGVSEDVTGGVLAVHVRATEGDSRPRIRLDRIDAIDMLEHNYPACLIGLRVSPPKIGFLFLQEPLIARLQDFLHSTRSSLSIRLAEFGTDPAVFDRELPAHVQPGFQHRLAIYKAQRAIETAAPGTSVETRQTASGGNTTVEVPWLASAFSIDPGNRNEVRVLAFEEGKTPDAWPGVSIRPEFMPLLELADGPTYLLGRWEGEEEITARLGTDSASTSFRIRRVGNEFAHIHEMGIYLAHSDRHRRGKGWVHDLQAKVFQGSVSLGHGSQALPFFRLLRPGAELVLGGSSISVDAWGPAFANLGRSVEAIEQTVNSLRLNLEDFFLGDLRDEEFANSLAFLHALLVERIPAEKLIPGFVMDPDLQGDEASFPSEKVNIDVPVVLNLKSTGLVVWIRGRANLFRSSDDRWCGLRFEKQLHYWHQAYPRFEKSLHPEAWISRALPPIPLGLFEEGEQKFPRQDAAKFVVEARVLPADEMIEVSNLSNPC
jgi:hypothetical protein